MISSKVNVKADDLSFVINNNAKYGVDVERQIKKLPHNLCQYLEDIGVQIVLLDDENGAEEVWMDIYGDYPGHIRGFTYVEGNTVYVEATDHDGYYEKYSECSDGLSSEEFNCYLSIDTMMHELGHIVDKETDFLLSSSGEFEDIFYDEMNDFRKTKEYNCENLKINANINMQIEYFATAFACYVKYPDSLLSCCPRTYNYIKSYLLEIESKYPYIEYYDDIDEDMDVSDEENEVVNKEENINSNQFDDDSFNNLSEEEDNNGIMFFTKIKKRDQLRFKK